MERLISCENVSFGYDGRAALQNLNLSLDEGDYLCILGENGSGKSTLVKGMLRLLAPLGGRVRYSPGLDRREIGYLAQEAELRADFPAGVWEAALSGNICRMGLRPFYSRREKRLAEENLERLGIAALKNRCFRELSGGERRRTLLARTLCAGRKLLALDEPAAGLDPLASEELYRLLGELNRERGLTIVMVSHDLEAAKKYAGRILNLGKTLPGLEPEASSGVLCSYELTK